MGIDISSAKFIWISLGLFLMILEFIVPGILIVFFGIAALSTGICLFFLDWSIWGQLFLFSLNSILFVTIGSQVIKKIFPSSSEKVDQPADSYKGEKAKVIREVKVHSPGGRIKLADVEWDAISHTVKIKRGETVEIVSSENLTMVVKPVSEKLSVKRKSKE